MYCTVSDGIEETEVSVISLTISSFVKKESVETPIIKEDTLRHPHIMPETVKISGRKNVKSK